jgi:uncharacterized membrane protein
VVQLVDDLMVQVTPLAPSRTAEDAARRALRTQIARLERQLADALVTGFPSYAVDVSVPGLGGPRLLGLGELEALRDDLAERLRRARQQIAKEADRQRAARELLEAMYANPAAYRFARLPRADLGVAGCGNYEVRPRLGLVGMLMGWWQVKLSSGCPLAVRGEPAAFRSPYPPDSMGRRSRKRSAATPVRTGEPRPAAAPTGAPRPAPSALTRRAPSSDRPPAPWGNFPLGELTTLAGIVLLIISFVSKDEKPLFVGFALVALSATELAAREHFAGFRSHSALLGLILGVVTAIVLVVAGVPRVVQIGAAVAAFAVGFWFMRRAFQARAGGLGFRA